MVKWTFKSYLASKHQIYTATELQKRVVKKTGVAISVAQLCKLTNATPSMLRLTTIEIICTALNCELNEFLQVAPKVMNPDKTRKLSYKNTPKSKIGIKSFPLPADYES
jgi:DNA-binding Xre family transcriptional regulator